VKTVIVDDERLARAELKRLLRAHPDVEIAGEAASADQAAPMIAALRPDLLLLDVQMPGGSGFQLLEALADVPAVVFTTAYDRYALRAFEVSAVDYLLKPIAADRLARALDRVRAARPPSTAPPLPGRIFVKDGDRCWLIPVDEITLLESLGNHTVIHYGVERPVVLRSLNQLEARLDPQLFFRASRKHIVNLARVRSVEPEPGGGLMAVLLDGTQVTVSRRQAQELRARLGL
jgi:two-component system LytT family response regulator